MKTLPLLINFVLLTLAATAHGCRKKQDLNWWKDSVIYHIYPRSFKDSNGDGIGDLNGITSKLEHVRDIGATAVYLSLIFASPQKDFGYDISNFTDIAEDYGTLDDFDKLVAKARSLGLKVLLDFVPNHSSSEHEWFKKSIDGVFPYEGYYIWRSPVKGPNGEIQPPNNWLSVYGGSAWEYNEKRKQYYYHAFGPQQPDLDFRDFQVRREMRDVLTFWIKRGVDGFRVNAINHLFEDSLMTEDPVSGIDVPDDDYDYLNHPYTLDRGDIYHHVPVWQKVLDDYTEKHQTDGKILLLEAYRSSSKRNLYYEENGNPLNFMFLEQLSKDSKTTDFKRKIDSWFNDVPANKITNWVTGNHDHHRIASRFGSRADQITMLASVLPGIMVVYNGDEIGMVDRDFTYGETVDPAGIHAGTERYQLKSRDPERTPFQWDDTTSAGFSSNSKTWLPVHENYRNLNLAAQKKAATSHYKVFQALIKLRKTSILQKGSVEMLLATDKVLAVVRRLQGERPVVLLMNFEDHYVTIDANLWLNIPESLQVYAASVTSGFETGRQLFTTYLSLPGGASVILH